MKFFRYNLWHILAKVLAEAVAVSVAFYLAFNLRFDGQIPPAFMATFRHFLPHLLVARFAAMAVVTRNRLRWRSTSLPDFRFVIAAIALGSAVFTLDAGLHRFQGFPRTVLLLEPFLTLNFLMAMRLGARVLWARSPFFGGVRSGPARRVLVVGAGDAGQRIVREMQGDRSANLNPVGFVDDDPAKNRRLIQGVPVLGAISGIAEICRERRIDQILIAIPSLSGSGISQIVRHCSMARADLTILPSLPQLISQGVTTGGIRKVSVEDLLERTPVAVDMDTIAEYTCGQRILVTGAGGSIGSELCRQIVGLEPAAVILLGQDENSIYWIEHELRHDYAYEATAVVADIKDRQRLDEVFREFRPTVVFHAAAHKHVPLMEANPQEAVKNNVFGTLNLAELAIEYGVRTFVMISTDKAVNPTSVMGTSKRVAENLVQSLAQRMDDARSGRLPAELWGFDRVAPENAVTRFSSVRFGNVLGSSGSVIPTMERQIAKGGPINVTHEDMVRYFMTIPEAVQLVVQAGAMGRGGEVFVLDMGKPVRIMDLAWNLIRLSGLVPEVDIEVKVTGVRPGEKLFEEMLTAEEGVNKSAHEKICIARCAAVDHAALRSGLRRLETAAQRGDGEAIRDVLKELVPTYRRYPAATPLHASGVDAAVMSTSAA